MSCTQATHPCVTCGACCHTYRVEFPVYELRSMGGSVPDALTHTVNGNRVRMNGTAQFPVRCHALTGGLGVESICNIYEQRSSTCRNFDFDSYRCHEARAKHGLPPPQPNDPILPLAA